MDKSELDRLRYLCGKAATSMSADDTFDLQNLAMILCSEYRELRSLLQTINTELKRATVEALGKV